MTEEQAALIARIEAATGPSELLNREIALAVNWRISRGLWYSPAVCTEATKRKRALGLYRGVVLPPDFTGSLDVALTGVPDGCRVGLIILLHETEAACSPGEDQEDADWERAASAPLALCLAALRARWAS